MKKDLLIGGVFVGLAALSIGAIMVMLGSQPEENAPKTIKSKPEPVASVLAKAVKEVPKKPVEKIRKIPIQLTQLEQKKEPAANVEKNIEPEKTKAEPKVAAKVEPIPEAKKESLVASPANSIVLGNYTKLNDPGGECTVQGLKNDDEVILLGKIKTLKLGRTDGKSVLNASELEAQEIIFAGDILGESQVKLHAPRGTVIIQGVVQGNSRLEVIAPDGKVVFKSASATIVNGSPKVDIVARHVELHGAIDGSGQISIALTKDGSLKFTQLLKGARLHYGKASHGDPEPRIEQGIVQPGAELRKIEPAKK